MTGRNAGSSPRWLTCSGVGNGWCRHGDGNADPAAAAVLPAAAPPAAAAEGGTEAESETGFTFNRSHPAAGDPRLR